MQTIKIPVMLPAPEVRELAEIAESKHCTVLEMIEEAVAQLIAREREVASAGTSE